MNAYSDTVEGMLATTCVTCGAEPGVWCVTASGRRAGHLHMSRWEQWRNRPEDPPRAEWPPLVRP